MVSLDLASIEVTEYYIAIISRFSVLFRFRRHLQKDSEGVLRSRTQMESVLRGESRSA